MSKKKELEAAKKANQEELLGQESQFANLLAEWNDTGTISSATPVRPSAKKEVTDTQEDTAESIVVKGREVVTSIRIDENFKSDMKEYAARHRMTMAQLIHMAVTAHMRNNP